MKLNVILTGLVIMLFTASGYAVTLKLTQDINLIVLDGSRISGVLLKGADGLVLNHGQHQLLFRIEKKLHTGKAWMSVPLIATFTTSATTAAINIKLPPLMTRLQGNHFNEHPVFQLVDENNKIIESRVDFLEGNHYDDFYQAMINYNLAERLASVKHFAEAPPPAVVGVNNSIGLASSDHPTGRLLNLWYQQVDYATRQRFVMLLRALNVS
ncbi:MAG: hypothetical protein XXXJIFNMEKO3_01016 [Candidatus Erwinia impunctatus]|nr:hypothetical protein XXXJIFNMEKO_01016 [Culicoides impunctatus]